MTLEDWAGAQNLALTLVFTDIVESTNIGIKLGDTTWIENLMEHFSIARRWARRKSPRRRRNGRSLFGLEESLQAQKKNYAASLVQREFANAWKNADVKLTIQDLWQ